MGRIASLPAAGWRDGATENVQGGGPPPPRPPCGGVVGFREGRLPPPRPPSDAVRGGPGGWDATSPAARWRGRGVRGGGPPSPRLQGGGVGRVLGGRAASLPAAGWRGGEVRGGGPLHPRPPADGWRGEWGSKNGKADNAPRLRVRSEPARVLPVPLYKARGGPHASVCMYVQPTNGTPAIESRTWATMANKWIARRPRFSAHSDHKHSKDLRARPDQIHPSGMAAIRFRTGATLANKWIARRPRFSAHSDHKHSKDLRARPDQIHPDPRAAQREAVELIP